MGLGIMFNMLAWTHQEGQNDILAWGQADTELSIHRSVYCFVCEDFY